MTSITIHRIANGKLVEKWSGKDVLGLLIQIGVMLPSGQQPPRGPVDKTERPAVTR